MQYPYLKPKKASRKSITAFAGLNRNLRQGAGELSDMKNLTSDSYPVLSPRGRRGVVGRDAGALLAKDTLCYTEGSRFVMGDYPVELGLTSGKKQLVSMGAFVIILPDKKYVNTADLSDCGAVEARVDAQNVEMTLCRADGTACLPQTVGVSAPAGPADGELWLDSGEKLLKQYSESTGLWAEVAGTYIKLSAPHLGSPFRQYDGVRLSGLTGTLAALDGYHVVWEQGEDYLLIPGLLEENTVAGSLTVSRSMPDMDFVVESGNRLWGCRYGLSADGKVVNELYACKLGDFKNWNCFMGLSTDSYVVSLGSDGPFTGAVTHLGYPLFFRENGLHKVYGTEPANFQVQTTACRGVQPGCAESLATVNETLLYCSRSGIMRYDGSLPMEASQALGSLRCATAAAGALGNKYYISLGRDDGEGELLVYDLARGLWHREDGLQAHSFCACGGVLYAIAGRDILALTAPLGQPEEAVEWMAETGPMGLTEPDTRYISRLQLSLEMEAGAALQASVRYDESDQWQPLLQLRSAHGCSLSLPVRPHRCRRFRLRLEGVGVSRLYALTQTVEEGSDLQ